MDLRRTVAAINMERATWQTNRGLYFPREDYPNFDPDDAAQRLGVTREKVLLAWHMDPFRFDDDFLQLYCADSGNTCKAGDEQTVSEDDPQGGLGAPATDTTQTGTSTALCVEKPASKRKQTKSGLPSKKKTRTKDLLDMNSAEGGWKQTGETLPKKPSPDAALLPANPSEFSFLNNGAEAFYLNNKKRMAKATDVQKSKRKRLAPRPMPVTLLAAPEDEHANKTYEEIEKECSESFLSSYECIDKQVDNVPSNVSAVSLCSDHEALMEQAARILESDTRCDSPPQMAYIGSYEEDWADNQSTLDIFTQSESLYRTHMLINDFSSQEVADDRELSSTEKSRTAGPEQRTSTSQKNVPVSESDEQRDVEDRQTNRTQDTEPGRRPDEQIGAEEPEAEKEEAIASQTSEGSRGPDKQSDVEEKATDESQTGQAISAPEVQMSVKESKVEKEKTIKSQEKMPNRYANEQSNVEKKSTGGTRASDLTCEPSRQRDTEESDNREGGTAKGREDQTGIGSDERQQVKRDAADGKSKGLTHAEINQLSREEEEAFWEFNDTLSTQNTVDIAGDKGGALTEPLDYNSDAESVVFLREVKRPSDKNAKKKHKKKRRSWSGTLVVEKTDRLWTYNIPLPSKKSTYNMYAGKWTEEQRRVSNVVQLLQKKQMKPKNEAKKASTPSEWWDLSPLKPVLSTEPDLKEDTPEINLLRELIVINLPAFNTIAGIEDSKWSVFFDMPANLELDAVDVMLILYPEKDTSRRAAWAHTGSTGNNLPIKLTIRAVMEYDSLGLPVSVQAKMPGVRLVDLSMPVQSTAAARVANTHKVHQTKDGVALAYSLYHPQRVDEEIWYCLAKYAADPVDLAHIRLCANGVDQYGSLYNKP